MKVQTGFGVTSLSGSTGGITAARNKAGLYIRKRTVPTNPNTSFQQARRAIVTQISQAWKAITAAQRAAWETLSAEVTAKNVFGDGIKLTGFATFMKCNMYILASGNPIVSDAPPFSPGTPITALTIATLTAAVMTASYAPTPTITEEYMLIQATPPVPPGQSFVKNRFRQLAIIAPETASPANLYAAYVARFGVPILGHTVYIRAFSIHVDTGLPSNIAQASKVVTA